MTSISTEDMQRLYALKAEADSEGDGYPDSWHPEVGGEIAGVFVRYTEAKRDGKPATVAVLRTSDGKEWSVWLVPTVLRNNLSNLQAGDAVFIRYEGKRLSERSGREYHDFKVLTDPNRQGDSGAFGPRPTEGPRALASGR